MTNILIENHTQYLLNIKGMDTTHGEFIDLVNRLASSEGGDFKILFNVLVDHTRAHFESENQWMKESAFPAAAEHIGEHQRVLNELIQFQKRVNKGSFTLARAFITQQAPEWFRLHITTMDAALAAHLNLSKLKPTG